MRTPGTSGSRNRTPKQSSTSCKHWNRRQPPNKPKPSARADVLLTHDTPLDLPDHTPRLQWVHAIGSGVGNLRYVPLGDHGITLTNSRGVASDPWPSSR